MVRKEMFEAGQLRLIPDRHQNEVIAAKDVERADDFRERLSRTAQAERGKGADIKRKPLGAPLRPKRK
ncbi:MAG: hypothetical protein MPW15_09210 [Candidatus Manganitrophus sp.]|nr:hypothetical protein [Candidatus Manganitrophus sp.]